MKNALFQHAVLAGLLLAPAATLAETSIAPLPSLPKGGAPIVMPVSAASVKITGAPELTATPATWEGVPGSLGIRINSLKTHPNPWNARVGFPFKASIAASDACLLWFYVRKTPGSDGTAAGGTALVESTEPGAYAKAVTHDFEAATSWSLVLIPFTAMQAVPAGHGAVSIHLGQHAQQIDIAGLSLLNFGTRVPLTDLPRPSLTYPGRETDAAWRTAALARIEANRKSDFQIKIVDAHGEPVPGAAIHVDLRRHEFGFGSAVTAYWLNAPGSDGAMYREIVDRYFSRVVLENDLKEHGWRLGRASPPDKQFRHEWTEDALHWLEQRGIEVRGHCLTWGVFDETTTPLKSNPSALMSRMLEHMDEVVPAVGHRVIEWDVINHPASWSPSNRIDTVVGPSLYPEVMRHARSLTTVPMWLNEDQVFRPGRQQEDFFKEARRLIDAGLPPDGLGIQGHFHSSFLPAPEDILRISDRFSMLVPRLQITEFDILANGDEQLQADWFRDCMIMAFSHPAYTGFQTWGFWERTVVRKEAMPWKADWSERPLAKVWKTWVGDYWHSKVDGKADPSGQLKFRGYHGRYTIAVKTPMGRRVTEARLDPEHREIIITAP